jgi:uncharacterized protein (DUF697 family)
MTRKPLPKAITRPLANLREIAGEFVADEQGRVPRHVESFDAVEPEPSPAPEISSNPTGAVSPTRAGGNFAGENFHAAAPDRSDPQAATRRAAARKIVERHKMYAAVGGLFPLPIVNIAGVTAINMRMVKALSDFYGKPFQRDRTRAMIVALMGGAVPTGLGAATASTLTFVVPGGALLGLGVSAIAAGALTRGIGMVFVESFESGRTTGVMAPAKHA